MAKVKFVLNLPGLNELMKSAYIQEKLDKAAEEVRDICGEGYETDSATLRWIGVSHVYASEPKAIASNAKHNTLLKAVGAVGLRTKK